MPEAVGAPRSRRENAGEEDGTDRADRTDQPDRANRDPNPAEEIFRQWGEVMFRIARKILPDDAEAEDAVMDALEKICARPAYFGALLGDERQLKLTVMRTVENAALDRWRSRKRRRDREAFRAAPDLAGDGEDPNAPDVPEPEESVGSAEEDFFAREEGPDFGVLGRAVGQLPETYRQVLLLRYGEEYGNREIAAMLGIPESTVASRLMRAKQMLRKKLEEGGRTNE